MGVIGWIVFGLIVGIVAKLLMPGRDPGGFFVTIVLGIVGALAGRISWGAPSAGTVPTIPRDSSWPFWGRSSCSSHTG